MSQAETTLFRLAQTEAFPAERQLLKDGKQVSNSSSLYTLSPFIDEDGLMRLESRIENASLPLVVGRPILLPPQHHITKLVVQQYYERNLHQNHDTEGIVNRCQNCKIKKALLKALPQRNSTDEVLRSALIEVEAVVNNRPLTYISMENTHLTAFTPNDFLEIVRPEKTFVVPDDTPETLVNNFRTSQVIANKFWKRWLHEYLPELTKRSKWHEELPNLKEGDLVIIVDPSSKRGEMSLRK